MAPKKPKTKNSEKIKFFKIGRQGDIKEAFPNDQTDGGTAAGTRGEEPVFGEMEENSMERLPEFKEESNPELEQQIHLLQPQVENISKIPERKDLTREQITILRKYISLKENEVRDLRDQKRQYQAFTKKVSRKLEETTQKNRELLRDIDTLRRRNESLVSENRGVKEKYASEMVNLKNDFDDKINFSENIDAKASHLSKEQEQWKQKVREDLKKIRLKERELENKYELLKRDSQALLDSKDTQILELKKKTDALDLELESMEERLRKDNQVLNGIDAKKGRLVETMKLAIALLEQIDQLEEDEDSESDQKAS